MGEGMGKGVLPCMAVVVDAVAGFSGAACESAGEAGDMELPGGVHERKLECACAPSRRQITHPCAPRDVQSLDGRQRGDVDDRCVAQVQVDHAIEPLSPDQLAAARQIERMPAVRHEGGGGPMCIAK